MPTRLALLDPATFFRRLGDHENLELVAIVRCSSHEGDRISPSLIARFRNPGVPPAWVSFGARHNAIRASPPRTESRQAPLSGSQYPQPAASAARLFPP